MNALKFGVALVFLFVTSAMLGQTTLTGTVVDETGTLPGASVIESGTDNGTTSDFDGNFSLTVESAQGEIEISFLGYETLVVPYDGSTDLGSLTLVEAANALEEVVLTGTIDIAKERETPVAVSTIRAVDIQKNLGTQELPEILNTTPSVYATKQGGGFGDARINIRGFDQQNTAVMINGQPVNDMENGRVFWSNWAGLADVTTAMQVQRGLGSSKLAISSVGGTINVITKTSNARQGGTVATTLGNDGYAKVLGSYSTGLLESGFSASILVSHTQGNGYVDGTKFNGDNWFIGLGYRVNERHDLQFIFTGAPQWHHQKSFAPSIRDHIRYQPGGQDDTATQPNRKYNGDWGILDGKEYAFRRNFYHKPVMSLNWEWEISDRSRLSTVVYGSWGRGGGTGEIGEINGRRQFQLPRDDRGLIRVQDIRTWNSGQSVPDFGVNRNLFNGQFSNTGNNGHPEEFGGEGRNGSDNGISRRASINSHNWYGGIANFHNDINDNWSFDVGVDLRTYEGLHWRVVNDVLGADNYIDYDNINDRPNVIEPDQFEPASPSFNPFQNIKDQEKIDYHNDGLVNWGGVFGQVEYKNDRISAFIQGSVSQQSFQRIEYFNELPENQKSEKVTRPGGNIKGGLNFNINENHNVFFNSGYYSKQPLFDAVFLNFSNTVNPDLRNEQIFGLEFGYGYRSAKLSANVNFYRTSWSDRFLSRSGQFDLPDPNNPGETIPVQGTANYYGIEQLHQGLEIDFSWRILDNLRLNGFGSFANWEYQDDVVADVFDDDQTPIGSDILYLKGVKVGDAAQVTYGLGLDYTFFRNFNAGLNWRRASDLYADFDPVGFRDEDNQGAVKLPSYDLVDARVSYAWNFDNSNSLELAVMVNNIFDELYISESETNIHAEPGDDTWKGIDTSNRVYFGFGTTWNTSIRFRF